MTELQNNLDAILLDKNTNLLPQNLKEGVTVLGVEGSLKVTGSDSNIKLFETVEDMNNDPNPKEDDLAVVYREEIQPFKEDTETQFITFPEQVILDEPFTGDVYGMLRAVDESVMFNGQVMLSQSMFDFSGYSGTGMIQVIYQSEDGITYTRQEFMGDSGDLTNPVDLGIVVKWEPMEPFNDVIGKFMLVGGNTFDGLYQYQEHNVNTKISYLDNIQYSNDTSSVVYDLTKYIDLSPYIDLINSFLTKWNMLQNQISIIVTNDGIIIYGAQSDTGNNSHTNLICTDTGTHYIGLASSLSSIENYVVHKVVIHSDNTFEEVDLSYKSIPNVANVCYVDTIDNAYGYTKMIFPDLTLLQTDVIEIVSNAYSDSITAQPSYYRQFDYLIASTQLTLNNPSQLLPDILAYGKNGNITGDGSIYTPNNTFADIPAQLYYNIKKQYDVMTPRVLTDDNKTIDKNIYFIPVKSEGTILLDTSKVLNLSYIFTDCKNLTEIPLINTSNATDMTSMFSGCENLQTIAQLNTSNVTNMNYMFGSCANLINIPQLNTSNVTDMNYMFFRCTSLTNIPNLNTSNATRMSTTFGFCSNLISISNIDTSNVTNMASTFVNCQNLETVPLLDTTRVNNMYRTFGNCRSLTNESLNNILYMCYTSNITNTSRKTLEFIGLTQDQANICMNLSNYQNFINAGWTTGY